MLEALQWLGIGWDKEPVRQSERRAHYDAAIEKLLAQGHAYRCVCRAEELAERREQAIAAGTKWIYDGRCREQDLGPDCGPHTVRLRVDPEAFLDWQDLVFGPSGQSAAEIGDMNIRRSDGHPLYNLAVVVDDLEMGITHVIRGADHLGNTAFQIALYRALGVAPPAFAHVPLIVAAGGKKLSKRRDPVSVESYRDQGYLPEALLNWLVRIGWSHGDQEIFSSEEIPQLFDLDAVNRSAAQADNEKLGWLNQHYIKTLPPGRLVHDLLPFLEQRTAGPVQPTPELARLAELLRERSRTLVDMAERAAFLVIDEVHFDEKASRKFLTPAARPILEDLRARLATLDPWTEARLEAVFEEIRHEHGDIGMGKLAQPVRVAVTGSSASPGIYETLAILGRERSVSRIEAAITAIAAQS